MRSCAVHKQCQNPKCTRGFIAAFSNMKYCEICVELGGRDNPLMWLLPTDPDEFNEVVVHKEEI